MFIIQYFEGRKVFKLFCEFVRNYQNNYNNVKTKSNVIYVIKLIISVKFLYIYQNREQNLINFYCNVGVLIIKSIFKLHTCIYYPPYGFLITDIGNIIMDGQYPQKRYCKTFIHF